MAKEQVYSVECKCGNWEEQPIDQQRWHIQNFEHLKDNDFSCECGETVKGKHGR